MHFGTHRSKDYTTFSTVQQLTVVYIQYKSTVYTGTLYILLKDQQLFSILKQMCIKGSVQRKLRPMLLYIIQNTS